MVENEKKVEERRPFEGSDGETYYIAPPTAEDVRGADWNYSKTYTKALMEDITTSSEMMGILIKRGIIGPEFEQRQRELSDILSEKITALGTASSVDERQILAMEVANAREELFQWNQRLNGPMSNTCEQIADDARLEYLTACMVQTEDGNQVWDSYETYLKERSQALALKARFEVMLYLQGLESDFLEKTPEAMALKEVRDELDESITGILSTEETEDTVDDETEAQESVVQREKDSTKNTNKKKPKKN